MPLENFKGPYRESNTEPPVLWRGTSTNWCDNVTCQNRIEYFQNLLCYFTCYLLLCSVIRLLKTACRFTVPNSFNFTRHRQIVLLIPSQIYLLRIK